MKFYEILVQHGCEQRKNVIQKEKTFQSFLFFSEESPQKFVDYRPVFFEGRPLWFQESTIDRPLQTGRTIDERQPAAWSNARVYFLLF
jgi:hypothetical protein